MQAEATMPQTFNVGARSLFVTLTAWAFIVLAALSVGSAVVQNASLAAQLPGWSVVGPVPRWAGLLVGYLPWVIGTGLLLSLATLAAAIGLLVRLEWARRVFIGLLVLAIAANLAGIWLQQEVLQTVVDNTLKASPLPQAAAGVFGGFVTATRAMAVAVSLGACALLVWIIRRLMSPAVRQEFA
jgi:hypothetical protein